MVLRGTSSDSSFKMVPVLSIALSLAFVFSNVIAQAQNAPPPAQVNCNSQVSALLPCLGYVQGQVNQPPQSCCSGLSSVVKASPFCLCSLIANTGPGNSMITGINSTLALELPTKCNIKGLDPRLCSGILGVPAPAPSPLSLRAPIASGPVANQSGATAPVQSPITPAPAPVLIFTAPTPRAAVSPVSGPSSQSFVPVASPQSQAVTKAPAPSPRHHRGGHGHKRHPRAPVPAPATAEAPVIAANPTPAQSLSPPPSQDEAQAPLPPVSIVSVPENAPALAPTAGGVSNAAAASAYCVKALALPVAIAFFSLLA